jgi:hypothetical protein
MSTTAPVAMLVSWSIPPDAQRFMAGSRAALVARPVAVAEFIGHAVR